MTARVVAVALLIASWKPRSHSSCAASLSKAPRSRSRYFTSGECKSSAICTTRSAAQRVQGCKTLNFARRLFLAARHTAVGDILIAGNWRIIPRNQASSVSLLQIARSQPSAAISGAVLSQPPLSLETLHNQQKSKLDFQPSQTGFIIKVHCDALGRASDVLCLSRFLCHAMAGMQAGTTASPVSQS